MREAEFNAAIAGRAAPPHLRFGVYRNNVASALINALRVRYPVAAKLLGTSEFSRKAGDFALSHLPQSAVLIGFGEGFAETLEAPLADVARLENLWWKAYHAAEAEPVAPEFLSQFPPEALGELRFRFHPSLGFMASSVNAGTVWQDSAEAIALEPQFILVARPEADVGVTLLPQASFDFITALANGETLAAAFESCSSNHQNFDLAHEIAGLLTHRIIIGATT